MQYLYLLSLIFLSAIPTMGWADPAVTAEKQLQAAIEQRATQEADGQALLQQPKRQGTVIVALRRNGSLVKRVSGKGSDWYQRLNAGIRTLAPQCLPGDALLITLCYDFVPVPAEDASNLQRGLRGYELIADRGFHLIGPLEMIARNQSLEQTIDRFLHETQSLDLVAPPLACKTWSLMHRWGSDEAATVLFRGNEVVPLSAVTAESVRALAHGLADWLAHQVQADGRMIYKVWPSRNEASSANNLIRQFMSTSTLARWAAAHSNKILLRNMEKNLRYNLEAFYVQEEDRGYVEYDGKVKLGAVALAGRAIDWNPAADQFAEQKKRLLAFTTDMQQDDGSFQTWYKGFRKEASTGHNFYPGETLLWWAERLTRQSDAALEARFLKSHRYYRAWHRKNKNPAFVPWQTMAACLYLKQHPDEDMQAFVFEMNDWLLGMQEWELAAQPDTRGRFYDANRPHFGVPHASSTGVYLEGLAWAYERAKIAGDQERMQPYRLAIRRGLRSLMQLQFTNEVDMFYITDRRTVRGGLRTTVYDNTLRCDNAQHALDACMKILSLFEDEDYTATD